jgi:hypothetical protein
MDSSVSLGTFEPVYRAHVAMVVEGDLKGVMADMEPASLAHVFDGVDVPRGDVDSAEVVRIAVVDGRGVGEAVYRTGARDIGLRSGWSYVDGRWLANSLENFEPNPE